MTDKTPEQLDPAIQAMQELVTDGDPGYDELLRRASRLGRLLALTVDDIEGPVARFQMDAAQIAFGESVYGAFRQGWHFGRQDRS